MPYEQRYLTGVPSSTLVTLITLTSQKVCLDEKVTSMGKKTSPSIAGTTNSMEPLRFELSMSSMHHSRQPRRGSYWKSPST